MVRQSVMPVIDTRERISDGATSNVADSYLLNMERLYRGESNTPVFDTTLRWLRLKALRKEIKRRGLKPLPSQAACNVLPLLYSDSEDYMDSRW